MKTHKDLKELLEAYEKFQDYDHYNSFKTVIDDYIEEFLASNSLALGKPEPLAKNKQFDKVCNKCNGSGLDPNNTTLYYKPCPKCS